MKTSNGVTSPLQKCVLCIVSIQWCGSHELIFQSLKRYLLIRQQHIEKPLWPSLYMEEMSFKKSKCNQTP
jgi:hypothetical protein